MKEIEEMLRESSKRLATYAAESSFEMWSRKDFRLYINFPNITQTEQDRIFNELEVSILGLLTLNFDHAVSVADKKMKPVVEFLGGSVREEFLGLFRELGIEEKLIKQWDLLIDMRFKEYRKHFKYAIKEYKKSKEQEFDEETLNTLARIDTITIDCIAHVRRGNVKDDDPLWKLLKKWIITIEARISELSKIAASA